MKNENETLSAADRKISVLDALVLLAENARLLVFGTLAFGLLALAICFVVPQSYTSEAILALPNLGANGALNPAVSQAAAMMTSPLVLDPVIDTLNLSEGRPIQVTRKKMIGHVRSTLGKDGLLRLDATANSPIEAQRIANAIIDSWLKTTIPGVEERNDLEKRLETAKSSLDAVERLLKRLTSDGGANLAQALTRGEAGATIVSIGELQTKYLGDVLSIPRTLRGFSRDVIKQPPTLPTETVAPQKALITSLAALAGALTLVIWIYVRQTLRTAEESAASAQKLAKLRSALRMAARSP